MKWFVMVNGGGERPLPLVDENENTMLYDTKALADEAGENNCLGEARGYEVYPWKY